MTMVVRCGRVIFIPFSWVVALGVGCVCFLLGFIYVTE